MKKRCKRLISLIIAMTMMLSFSTVAFAAETEEPTVVVENTVNEGNSEVMPASDMLINLTGYKNGSSATTLNMPITLNKNGYLYFTVMTKGPIRVTLYSNGVQVGSARADKTWTEDEVQWVPIYANRTTNNFWNAGNYTVKVEVLFNYDYTFGVFLGDYKIE